MTSYYRQQEHTIVGGDLSAWLERLVENDPKRKGHLFLVRYNKLGVFVIAEWLDKYNIFVDVLNLGKSLANFGFKAAQELRRRLFAPVTAEETMKIVNQNDSDFYHRLQDEDSEETERRERVTIGE